MTGPRKRTRTITRRRNWRRRRTTRKRTRTSKNNEEVMEEEEKEEYEYNDLDVLCVQGKICIVLVSLVVLVWCFLSILTYFCPARIQSATRRVRRPCAGRNCGTIIAEQLRCAACYLRWLRHHMKGRPMSVFAAANSMDVPWFRRIRILSRLTMTHEITV